MDGLKVGSIPAYPVPVFNQKAQITEEHEPNMNSFSISSSTSPGEAHDALAPSCDLIMSVNKGWGRQRRACRRDAGR